MKTSTKAKIGLGFTGLVVGSLYFGSPNSAVVNEAGEIVGIANQGMELLQGQGFWQKQLTLARDELDYRLVGELRFNDSMRRLDRETDELIKEFNADFPPSPAELREDRAWKTETEEYYRKIEIDRVDRIAVLRKIIPIIEGRVK